MLTLKKRRDTIMKKILSIFTVLLLTIPFVVNGQTNGTNMIGYGTKSVAMGGADVAWIWDINALNINPAGIVFSESDMLGVHLGLMIAKGSHSDMFGNDISADAQLYPLPIAGYLHKFSNDFAMGIGAFAHGGMGSEFTDVNTVFGTVDMMKSQIMHLKGVLGLAYKITPGLSIGATVDFSYAAADLSLFPDTSRLDMNFAGMETTDLTATCLSFKAGLMYKLSDFLSFGAAYKSKTTLEFDGTMALDFSSMPGFSKINFDTTMTDFNWPQQFEFGFALKPLSNLTIAVDAAWMNFEDSVWESVLSLTAPAGYEMFNAENTFYFHWNDMWVVAVGADLQLNPNMAVQLGYNYGKNPVPEEYTNPLFLAIVEHHFTAGLTYKTEGGTEYQVAASYVPANEVSYTNLIMPFGPDATGKMTMFSINFGANFVL
jgi:long-chain fatty acid transport protein